MESTENADLDRKPNALGRLGGLVAGLAPTELQLDAQRIKKPNEAIALKVVGDLQMGELHRKLLNVMIRIAQDEKQPGRRLPPAAFTQPGDIVATLREYFWAPLEEFVRDARYNSHDTKLLKETLEEMQELRLRSDGGDWLSEVPVSSVRFLSEAGRSTWVGFAFAPETRRLVMRPRQYTEILLQMQRLLNSGPAIALYERCRQYLTSPGRKTPRAPWTDWYFWLSGQPIDRKPPQFKYWNRDTLKRIEAEVNAVSDIAIKRIEFRVGRQIEDLQYEVSENPQTKISFPEAPPIDTELRARLLALQIPPARADRLMSEHDRGLLHANLAYTEQAFRNGRLRQKPISYLVAALRENYAGNVLTAQATLQSVAEDPVPVGNELLDRFMADQAKRSLELYAELGEGEQAAAVQRFLESASPVVLEQHRRGGLNAPLVKSAFAHSFARATWGEPKPEDLVAFANAELARQAAQRSAGAKKAA